MLVATVTAPTRPAWAMMAASRSWCLALSTSWGMPCLRSRSLRRSDFSMEIVPTSTGWPSSWRPTMSSTTAANLPRSVM